MYGVYAPDADNVAMVLTDFVLRNGDKWDKIHVVIGYKNLRYESPANLTAAQVRELVPDGEAVERLLEEVG